MSEEDTLVMVSSNGFDLSLKKEPTREYVPIFYYCRKHPPENLPDLGVRSTVSDLAESISEAYELEKNFGGVSFWNHVIRNDVQSNKRDVLNDLFRN